MNNQYQHVSNKEEHTQASLWYYPRKDYLRSQVLGYMSPMNRFFFLKHLLFATELLFVEFDLINQIRPSQPATLKGKL